jgi:hypothetical protein
MAELQSTPPTASTDPRDHSRWLRSNLDALAEHARDDVARVDDPRAQALFETTAEVLKGLARAYADFESKNEPARRGR